MAAISRCTVPAKPQEKAQERGGRHSSISEMLRSTEEKGDHLGDGAITGTLLLEPVTGIAGCKQYVPRVVAAWAVAPETAYQESGETLIELLLKLQGSDPFVQQRQYERFTKPTITRDIKT